MNMPQIIKSAEGVPEYALIPFSVYRSLKNQIESAIKSTGKNESDYIAFRPEDYVSNPVTLARINARLTQAQLAERLAVSQAYISKIEAQNKVTAKLLDKVHHALKGLPSTQKKARSAR
jgi:DNA-binding XRE family transcriptional regulator